MTARIGVITFPGTLDDVDAARAARLSGAEAVSLWHDDADLKSVDAVIVPGGFSYGDYLRAGAIARFAPVMRSVVDAAAQGLPILGICNGFQVLCEAGLLPGALTRNAGLHFVCRDVWLGVDANNTAWSSRYERDADILVPLKSGEGRYVASDDVLDELRARVGWSSLPREPQRFDARYRRHFLGQRPRGGAHAAPGARDRAVDRPQ